MNDTLSGSQSNQLLDVAIIIKADSGASKPCPVSIFC